MPGLIMICKFNPYLFANVGVAQLQTISATTHQDFYKQSPHIGIAKISAPNNPNSQKYQTLLCMCSTT